MSDLDLDNITLTDGQEAAWEFFIAFLLAENMPVMRLAGYAGTGKSTLVRLLLKRLEAYKETWKLLTGDDLPYTIQLTATTNKAAEALRLLTGQNVQTIHSFLGLRVHTDYTTGRKQLIPGKKAYTKHEYLLFVDEASMVDPRLLELIFDQTRNCKIVFMGDPAQLPPVKFNGCPVFLAEFPEAALTEVVRQAAGSPINELATQFRHTVADGVWRPFTPDGDTVIHLDREAFDQALMAEMSRPDWKYADSKLLAYTNARAIVYNNALRAHVQGNPELQPGDYAVCNSYVRVDEKKISTDDLVYIKEIEAPETIHNIRGRYVTVNEDFRTFAPYDPKDIERAMKWATDNKKWSIQREVEGWIDLRAAYAQTVNKSQGSTYDRVFIDLDDIASCTNGNLIARLMYVAVSRARYQVYLTGDFG